VGEGMWKRGTPLLCLKALLIKKGIITPEVGCGVCGRLGVCVGEGWGGGVLESVVTVCVGKQHTDAHRVHTASFPARVVLYQHVPPPCRTYIGAAA
jgi:hypothetical protein